MSKMSKYFRFTVSVYAIMSGVNDVAMAQQAPPSSDAIEEVLVTARRREESELRIPVSITAFSENSIKRNNITTVGDYLALTPNVAFREGPTREDNGIYIRGISNVGGVASAFGFYIDEVNVGLVTNNPHLQDIERIEVLRGPQGTYFGRNSTAGAISITTKKPTDKFELEGFVGASSFGTTEVNSIVNIPVVSEKLSVRAVGYWEHSDGYIKNVNPVGGSDDHRYLNGRLTARFTPTESLTVDTSVMRTVEKTGLDRGVATHVLPEETAALLEAIGLSGPITDGLDPFPRNRRQVNNNNPKETTNKFTVLNGRIAYDFSGVTLVSVTGYVHGGPTEDGDVDNTSFDIVNLRRETRDTSFSEEVRLSSHDDQTFVWTIGGLFARDKDVGDLTVVFGDDNPVVPPGTVVRRTNLTDRTTSYALFGEVDWHATDRLTVTVGARYTHDRVSQEGTIVSFGQPTVFSPQKTTFNDISPKISILYGVTENIALYATSTSGYKSGGIQLDQNPLLGSTFKPENILSNEAGIKGTLADRRFQFQLSAFHVKWEDMQVSAAINVVDPETGAFIIVNGTTNAAKASTSGIELQMQAKPWSSLEIGGGVGYLDAEFDEFTNGVVAGRQVSLTGERLPGAPQWTMNAYAQYTHMFGDAQGFLRGEWSYRTKSAADLTGLTNPTFPNTTPAYGMVNFRAGLERDRYSLVAYVENAFDRNYYTATFDDIFFTGPAVDVHPRIFGVRLSAKY